MDLINQYVGPSQHHRQQPIGDGRWFIQPIFARISEMVSVLGWIPHYQMHKWMRSWGFLPAWWLGSYREGFVFPSLGLSFFFGNHVVGRYATLLPKNYIPWNCFEWLRVLSAKMLRTLGGSTSFWEPMVAWLPAWRPKPGSLHCFYFLHFFFFI